MTLAPGKKARGVDGHWTRDLATDLACLRTEYATDVLVSLIEPHVMPSFMGDASRVRQILLNLIGNAVKFTEKGEVTLRVSSAPVSDNVYRLEFLISDTGTGISPEAIGKLFQPFQRLHDASEYPGTGIGLASVRRTIEREIVELVRERIGPVAVFKTVLTVDRLPKTRSGKILRASIRKIADGENAAVPPTIEDPAALEEIGTVLGRIA